MARRSSISALVLLSLSASAEILPIKSYSWADGLGFGDNSKAALVTRAIVEIRRLGVACGAQPETFTGLSGLGDLMVTCFSKLSRNRGFGERVSYFTQDAERSKPKLLAIAQVFRIRRADAFAVSRARFPR